MKTIKPLWLLGLILAAIAAILFWPHNHPNKQKTAHTIRIGVLKHESTLPVYVADQQGFFKENGIDVQITELPPGDHMPALLADRVDIISPTSFPTLFGVMAQHPGLLYAIMPGAEVVNGPTVYGILVKHDSPLQSIREIHGGLIIAINPFTKVNMAMILDAAGVPASSQPNISIASREAAITAVLNGTASAAILDQPALAVALQSTNLRLLESNPRAKYVGTPYWSGAGAIKQSTWNLRKGDIDAFLKAIDEAIIFSRHNPTLAHQILASRLGLNPDIAAKIGGYYFPVSTEHVDKSGIEKTISALRSANLLPTPPSLKEFFPPGVYGQP